jgi:putative endonuclease
MKKIFYLYILTNHTKTVLYIGSTSNLAKRIYEHKLGLGSTFTSRYKTTRLVYYEFSEDMETILRREQILKRWRRKWKEQLITEFNPKWNDLYKDII